MDALRPGARVGRYRLLERVGAGGMAEVFAARTEGAEGFSRTVAIKVVHSDASDEENLRALIDEARVASSLRHPNIVQVYELDRHGDGLYMVMEFLDGWPLDKLLKMAASQGVQAPLQAVVGLGTQLLDALAYAHTAPTDEGAPLELVHRDIKPSNLMLDALGLVKVVDFGIARASNIERRTATGVGKGTPAYMSPEQLYGQPVDPRSDLFAAGCVLFELATGTRLFDANAFGPLILRRQEGFTEADDATLRAACPELADIIGRAIRQEMDERWPDAASMRDAVRAAAPGDTREPVRRWLAEVLGGDPSALKRTVAEFGGSDDAADTAPRSNQVAATAQAPLPGVIELAATAQAPLPLVTDGVEPIEETRLVERPTPSRAPWILGAGAAGLLALLAVRLLLPETPETLPGAIDAPAIVDVTPRIAAPSPSDRTDPTPEPTAPPPAPEPTAPAREPTPPAPEPTPEPVAVAPTPQPTPVTAPGAARGSLFVSLLPSSGVVAIAGVDNWTTPDTRRLPPGVHEVKLLDKEGGLLGSARVRIQSGETSRCVWRKSGGRLELQPPLRPDDVCEVVP